MVKASKKSFKYSGDKILLFLFLASLVFHYVRILPFYTEYALIVLSFAGLVPVFWSALESLKHKRLSVDLLASIALIFSIISHEWASSIFINLMLTFSRIFTSYTENRARKNIEHLLKLKPEKAKIKKGDRIFEVEVRDIEKGDLVIAELGERIPIDGTVAEGSADIDQSSITGESVPVSKKIGDSVLSSSIVVSGNLAIKTEKIGKETTLEKIIDLVEKSQDNKAEITTVADKFTLYYIVAVIIGSIFLYFYFKNLNMVLAVILVVCADDIAIAIPLAYLAAIGYAARRGIIIKGANFLEGMSKVKVMIADKTGTLTKGKFRVEEAVSFGQENQREMISLAASVSAMSEHPLSKAILNYAEERKIAVHDPENYEEFSGKGTKAVFNKKNAILGKLDFLKEEGVKILPSDVEKIKMAEEKGASIVMLAENGKAIGFFALADELKPHVKKTIAELKGQGVKKIVMLTGDNEKIAEKIAAESGITDFHSNLLPQDKIKYLKKYISKKYKTIMVGDGVNDAASLSLADIGIAMGGTGYDVAIESADIVLMKDDFSRVPEIIELSKYVSKVAKQDFVIWGTINAIGLVLVFGGWLSPTGAAAYNFITDFFPLINSSKILGMYYKKYKV